MMSVKQVSSLTGISVRTLQFYDETGMLKPSELTDKGYRLYDEHALETSQQILFFIARTLSARILGTYV